MGKHGKHQRINQVIESRRSSNHDPGYLERVDALSLSVSLHGAIGRLTLALKDDAIDPGAVVRTADVFRDYLADAIVPEAPPVETP